jgi:hypothetical protein
MKSWIQKLSGHHFLLLLSFFLILIVPYTLNLKSTFLTGIFEKSDVSLTPRDVQAHYNRPQIYISSWGGNTYASGGLVSQTVLDEPSIEVVGYNLPSGKFDIEIYKADNQLILDYLTYNKDYKQISKIDTAKLEKVISFTQEFTNTSRNANEKIELPNKDAGIWYLVLKNGDASANALIIRTGLGAIAKKGDGEFVFWVTDIKSKRSVTSGQVKVYNLSGKIGLLNTSDITSDGTAKAPLTKDSDIAIIESGSGMALIPLNLKYLNYGYSYNTYTEKVLTGRFFTFTDRPIYRPGDTVNFKSIIRNEDDARYFIPGGTVKVEASQGWDESKVTVYKGTHSISSVGSINGSFKLPDSAKTGDYTLTVTLSDTKSGSSYFNVEYYRKPEYFVDLLTDNKAMVSGDDLTVKVSGQYFSGQPLKGAFVSYKIYSYDFYEYDYYSSYLYNFDSESYRYGWWYGSSTINQGVVPLDEYGIGKIDLPIKLKDNNGKNKVVSVEVSYMDPSGNPVIDRKNYLVYAGDYSIFRKDYGYGSQVKAPYTLPIKLATNKSGVSLKDVGLKANIKRTSWVSYQEEGKKYLSYRKEEENLQEVSTKTNSEGEAEIVFIPEKTGSYTITVSSTDSQSNEIKKEFWAYIWDDNYYYSYDGSENTLSVYTEKPSYKPGDIAKLHITSDIPDRDVFLSLERGRLDRYQVVSINGKSTVIDLPIVETDIPNVFASAVGFNEIGVDSSTAKILTDTSAKKLKVKITPDGKKYGPGDAVTLDLLISDDTGNPVQSEATVWMVDKSLYELATNNTGDIFKAFWSERSDNTTMSHSLEGITVNMAEMGGCFAQGTKVVMFNGEEKNIENVRPGDYILTKSSEDGNDLVKAKVKTVHSAEVNQYLVLNGSLRVTANHVLYINHKWDLAGNVQLGDVLVKKDGSDERVISIERLRGKTKVYNLEVEKFNTFFAQGYYVHNEKGGGERSVFKDAAYWNASVWTDASGHAVLSVKLPDNLTTWAISAVAATSDTRVGQTTNEIIVSKDIVVRPVLPNILRIGDKAIVSAMVHNFTENDKEFNVSLKFDAGDVENAQQAIKVPGGGVEQLYWSISPMQEKDASKMTFSAINVSNKNEGDTIIQQIPVRIYGFRMKKGEVGEGNKTYNIKLSPDSVNDQTSVYLNLAPTLLNTLPEAMKYLINYPYGCIEQTTSRFVPVVIARDNRELFAEAMEGKKVDEMIDKGLERLSSLQSNDGGWGWWHESASNPFISAYVVEYLLIAKDLGYPVDSEMLYRAQIYFENLNLNDPSAKVIKFYALTLLDSEKRDKGVELSDTMTPDVIALGVMANYANGLTNSSENGLKMLLSKAKDVGGNLYWEAGNSNNFGSKDASTALAMRAVLTSGGDRDIAVQASRYLTSSRRSEYWSNTFSTAQVIRALVELSKSGSEMSPDYSYRVLLDGNLLKEGTVTDARQIIKNIQVPVNKIKDSGSKLDISYEGVGQLYSTFIVNEFRTDKNYVPFNQPLSVVKEIYNEKGKNYSIGAGDTVIINIQIDGLKEFTDYGVVEDHLPGGMVPIIETLNNERGSSQRWYYYSGYGKEYLEDGVVLSLNRMYSGVYQYSYKARVINSGTYAVPPVVAGLMYSPEIFGVSEGKEITIEKESKKLYDLPQVSERLRNIINARNSTYQNKILLVVLVIILAIMLIFILNDNLRRRFTEKIFIIGSKLRDGPFSKFGRQKPPEDDTQI